MKQQITIIYLCIFFSLCTTIMEEKDVETYRFECKINIFSHHQNRHRHVFKRLLFDQFFTIQIGCVNSSSNKVMSVFLGIIGQG